MTTATPTPTVCDCGHPPTTRKPGAMDTGYGTTSDGRTRCYACCDAMSLREILAAKPGDRSFAYLSDDDRTVISWTGCTLLRVVRCWETREGFASHHYGPPRTVRIWAVDTDGNWWSGRGPRDSGTYVRLRRLAREPR